MSIKRINLVITLGGEPHTGKTTMLKTISAHLQSLGYKVDDAGADKEHQIVASYPIIQSDNPPAPKPVTQK